MELVTSLDDIKENITTLENYLKEEEVKEFAKGLIKRGTCFAVTTSMDGYNFYPSIFIGYKNNTYSAHSCNYEKDEKKTNPAIIRLLKEPLADTNLEVEYEKYCQRLGFEAPGKGAEGEIRKYWML